MTEATSRASVLAFAIKASLVAIAVPALYGTITRLGVPMWVLSSLELIVYIGIAWRAARAFEDPRTIVAITVVSALATSVVGWQLEGLIAYRHLWALNHLMILNTCLEPSRAITPAVAMWWLERRKGKPLL